MRWRIALGYAVLSTCIWFVATPASAASDARGKEVGYRQLDHFDAEVFMEVRVTRGQVARVRQELKRWPAVHRFGFLDQHDAYQVFSRIFRDSPNLVKKTDPASLPTSFRVDLATSDDRFALRNHFEALVGVDTVEWPLSNEEKKLQRELQARDAVCGTADDAEVFMQVNATPAQEQAVANALATITGIESAHRVSHEEAKVAFDCLFVNHPDKIAQATAENLPVSFRLDLSDPRAIVRVLSTVSDMPGVDEVRY